jgi:alkylhydroperoxidase/carboxymuconolactone decarboxylase family protein YurZ
VINGSGILPRRRHVQVARASRTAGRITFVCTEKVQNFILEQRLNAVGTSNGGGVIEIVNRGLILTNPDSTSAEELEAFRATYQQSHGKQLAAYDFWLEFNPSVVKRHRLQAYWTPDEQGRKYQLPSTLGFLYLYTLYAYEEGIRYETDHAHALGATDAAILQVFELAFVRCGPRGMDAAWTAARPLLGNAPLPSDDMSDKFPAGWRRDPGLFDCGFDLSDEELTPEEIDRLRGWYVTYTGEVPKFVDFLARMRPGLLKAYRLRLEAAMRGPLPAQILPFMELQAAVATAQVRAVRESLNMAHGLKVSPELITEAIGWGMLYGGPEAVSVAAELFDQQYGDDNISHSVQTQ